MKVVVQAGSTQLQSIQHLYRGRSQEMYISGELFVGKREKKNTLKANWDLNLSLLHASQMLSHLSVVSQFDSQAGSLCCSSSCDSHVTVM